MSVKSFKEKIANMESHYIILLDRTNNYELEYKRLATVQPIAKKQAKKSDLIY